MSTIKKAIYSSLLAFKPESVFNDPVWSLLTPVSSRTFLYNGAFYVHVYEFEQAIDFVASDGVIDNTDRAFRDIEFSAANEFHEIIWSASVDLDDQPL